ncbi:protein VAC14 homolog isoform X1 [Physcomitrium patens]|uniref:protein VAC14 homolog isoform X1 n=1 Tax=Physcomitrium patens TaxID=3218 RepID=UPI000D173C65|nr:protein VAC14 homolog isoform X1 [Physcomitrium patens]|eukprot:XP_024389765.1 protein VAC14 homolog isoform X1 [Physcomitrella patens]
MAKMADGTPLLSASTLRTLADKLYEKRKNAAREVEAVIRGLVAQQDHQRISSLLHLLVHDFALSPQSNHRKQGGLIGLAAATMGLGSDAAQHLEKIIPPVLNSFTDQDIRVRYYACEALYNIAKATRGDLVFFFNDIFDALCKLSADSEPSVQQAAHLLDHIVKDIVAQSDQFSIEEFIPLLRERMNVLNPFVRQFLVGWITVLDRETEIDMLGFLPDFLDGLFNMLSDSSHEIRQQADSALEEFLREIKDAPSVDYGKMAEILVQRAAAPDEFTRLTSFSWLNEFVKLSGEQLVPYYADILGALLPAISDNEERIRVVAKETNEELRSVKAEPAEGFDIGAVLVIARRELGSDWEATRLEALRWIALLLERHRTEVLSFLDDIFPALLSSLADTSDEVVCLVLEVQACIAGDAQHFHRLMVFLVHKFKIEQTLLEKRGTLALRRLCTLLDAERVYRELATIFEGEADLEFATIMVQALNLILLTAPELAEMRSLLKLSLLNPAGGDLFVSLSSSWCHSSIATVSLCLLAQAYQHASAVIQALGESDINVNLLVQVDKLVRLLETPTFAYLRLQLLEPGRYPSLLKTLYGLLMLLPQQSAAFKMLRTRLKTVPSQTFMHMQSSLASSQFPGLSAIRRSASAGGFSQRLSHIPSIQTSSTSEDSDRISDSTNGPLGINFAAQLKQFEYMQHQHHLYQSQNNPPRRTLTPPPAQNGHHPSNISDDMTDSMRRTRADSQVRMPQRTSWRS